MTAIRKQIEACIASYIRAGGARDSALTEIDEIIKLSADGDHKNRGYAYFAKGNLLVRLGRHTEALSCLRKAASFDHDNPSILFNLGMEEITAGNKRAGNEYLVRAGQSGHPKAADALASLKLGAPIEFGFNSVKDVDARADAVEVRSVVAEHIQRGMADIAVERYADALIEYNRAIEFAPDFGHTYTLRGVVYEKLERYREALADHDRAI